MNTFDKRDYDFFNDEYPEEVELLHKLLVENNIISNTTFECELMELLLDWSIDGEKGQASLGNTLAQYSTSVEYSGAGEYSSRESNTSVYIYGVGGRELCEVYYSIGCAHCSEPKLLHFEVIPNENNIKECLDTSKQKGENMATLSTRIPDTNINWDGVQLNNETLAINTNKGENNMRNIRTINLSLTDNDENLSLEDTLVFSKEGVRTEHTDSQTQQNILMTGEVQEALEKHNKKRIKTVDKDVLRKTGNKVNLEPVVIWDLEWKVVQIA